MRYFGTHGMHLPSPREACVEDISMPTLMPEWREGRGPVGLWGGRNGLVPLNDALADRAAVEVS